ncbi:cyanamide hydratase [Aspergillus campestris IBT 28561]|uniref:Cyanamide hydratase n=1 Tax=Aspergillus campestris (strain IBT 28561) TaxID=1392248 RepID=A0A2I1D060_ASPC2|nr:cyanamide hydratase [Aspergillus campestris IBT 28561]PKY03254.1 cyanamide hydratase [Aspergillus campestris IBT 28561]
MTTPTQAPNPNPNPIQTHGFTAIPASSTKFTDPVTQKGVTPHPLHLTSTPIPTTPLAQRILSYAQSHLPTQTLQHSLRVYHYGLAMKQYLSSQGVGDESSPGWAGFSDETFFLACMLHDIGTTEENMRGTRLSFEFAGGVRALGVLLGDGGDAGVEGVASKEQAESVVEAIVRHQDLCEVGWITALGGVLQLGTIFDNTGKHAHLLHEDTIQEVIRQYPRTGWSACFAGVVKEEIRQKPWAHSTVLGEEFAERVLGNPYGDE